MNIKEMKTGISRVARMSKNLVTEVQLLAIATSAHRKEHGDNTLMTELVKAVSKGHQELLKKYLSNFAAVSWSDKDDGFKNTKADINLEEMAKVNWNEYAKVMVFSDLTFDKVLSRINKLVKDVEGLAVEDQNKIFELINLDKLRLVKAT